MQVVVTSQSATKGFGTYELGNHPPQYDKEGLLVFAANYTYIRHLIDQNRPEVLYLQEISCGVEPVQKCEGTTDPPLTSEQIYCLGIVNPNNHETKFSASISFTQGVDKPPLTIPFPEENPTSSSAGSSPTSSEALSPTDTRSFIVPDIANKLEIIDFGYLLVISWLSSIFISILFNL